MAEESNAIELSVTVKYRSIVPLSSYPGQTIEEAIAYETDPEHRGELLELVATADGLDIDVTAKPTRLECPF